MELGKMIRQLRCKKHVGQKELAAYLRVSTETISNYENGVCGTFYTISLF